MAAQDKQAKVMIMDYYESGIQLTSVFKNNNIMFKFQD